MEASLVVVTTDAEPRRRRVPRQWPGNEGRIAFYLARPLALHTRFAVRFAHGG